MEQTDDPRVRRLFREFPDVSGVLVAADFVAVTLRRPERWEALIGPLLQVVSEEFADTEEAGDEGPRWADRPSSGGQLVPSSHRHPSRLERAWQELGSLRPEDAADLERVRAAASDEDQARRQVAASLLRHADAGVARALWAVLARDRSRVVRRAAVDAMVDVGREELRSLLEQALGDGDAWVRWKALRGLAELGPSASRGAIEPLTSDRDFRVRLEAQAALRPDQADLTGRPSGGTASPPR